MGKLIRNPLTWMVVAEIVVVTALIVLAWNAIATATHPPAPSPLVAVDPSVDESPLPDLPMITKPDSTAPQPGLNVDPLFWLGRLRALNQDQVVLEQLEWRVVDAATTAAHRYLETVVLPAVTAAEKGGRL